MQLRSLILPVALLISVPALAQDAAAKGGQIELPDFHGVAVSHGIHAEVKPGPKSVRLEGNKDDLARVKLEVKDGVLTTQVEKTSTFFNKGLKDVRLYVTSPRVESVVASGGSEVDATVTRVDTFEVVASGGSELEISGVDSQKLQVVASGGSELELEGRASELKVTGSGGSIIGARKVRAGSLQVVASGGTRVEADPEQSIQGALSGGSTVKAARKPANVQVSSSGGSQVQYE